MSAFGFEKYLKGTKWTLADKYNLIDALTQTDLTVPSSGRI